MNSISTLTYAGLAGILPALAWLWFWLREDKLHPEPTRRIALCFIAEMIAVLIVIGPERLVAHYLGFNGDFYSFFQSASALIKIKLFVSWSAIEELAKYMMVLLVALQSKDFDEPVDALMYTITVALGFSALENAAFVLPHFLSHDIAQGFIVGNLRFLGASLLHVVSSAAIGFAIAHSFYMSFWKKIFWNIGGVVTAIILHTTFNFFIIDSNGSKTFLIFGILWTGTIILLLLFEKLKKLNA